MKRLFSILLAASLLATAIPAEQENILKVYPIQSTTPDVVTKVVQDLVGAKGQVTYDKMRSQLFVSAPAEMHILIAPVLKEIDAPSPNVRIDVVHNNPRRVVRRRLDPGIDGDVRITPNKTGYRVSFKPQIEDQSGGGLSNHRQTVVVASGAEGVLFVGEDIPWFEWLIDYAQTYGQVDPRYVPIVEQQFERREVGSQLRVSPRIIGSGPLISLTLTPEISSQVPIDDDDRFIRIRFSRVSTTVTVCDGQSIQIGGVGESKEFFDRFLVGRDQNGDASQLNITVTATIQQIGERPRLPDSFKRAAEVRPRRTR